MLVDGVLPSLKQCLVSLLFVVNAPLVIDLGQLGGPLFVHLVLQVPPCGSVALTHLAQDVCLVGLLHQSVLHRLGLVSSILSCYLSLVLLQFVVLQPLGFLFLFLLEEDGLLAILVDVLHEVDSGLVLPSPLRLSCLPLLDVLILYELIDHLLVLCFLIRNVSVVLLQLDNLVSACLLLSSLNVLHLLLSKQSSVEKILVPQSVLLLSLFPELLLCGIVIDQLKVPLAIKQELLLFCLFLPLLFIDPLLLEHLTLLGKSGFFLLSLDLAGVSLPVEHGHGVFDLLLLDLRLMHFTLQLLLRIELPQLSVDLLFHHFSLYISSLVDQLLLALNGGTIVIEHLIFFS